MKKDDKNVSFETLSTEDKLNNLNTRLIKLEKIEHKRKVLGWVNLGFKIVGLIILIVLFIKAYAFLKDYKEKLEKLQTVQDKLNVSESFLDEQLKNIEKFINTED
jgi:hypothetical protein